MIAVLRGLVAVAVLVTALLVSGRAGQPAHANHPLQFPVEANWSTFNYQPNVFWTYGCLPLNVEGSAPSLVVREGGTIDGQCNVDDPFFTSTGTLAGTINFTAGEVHVDYDGVLTFKPPSARTYYGIRDGDGTYDAESHRATGSGTYEWHCEGVGCSAADTAGGTGTFDWQLQLASPTCPASGALSQPSGPVEDDADSDNIPDDVENEVTHTNPNCPDTDGDGLLDPWEVDPGVEGAGFDLNGDKTPDVARDDVFGPYIGQCGTANPGPRREPLGQKCNLVARPDPRHKDVYIEMDWQDCLLGDCPELVGVRIDPSHHAPDMSGLSDIVGMFGTAPVDNPDGESGVHLHILVDEAIRHSQNCDQGDADARPANFGTATQRGNSQVMSAKEKAFRYAWSGHSSLKATAAECPLPDFKQVISAGYGVDPLPEYDISPHGYATPRGRDVLVTLAVNWICQLYTYDPPEVYDRRPPCFRLRMPIVSSLPDIQATGPGLFPAKIAQPNGAPVSVAAPLHTMLGIPPSQGVRQLWGRAFANLLGQSLGVPAGQTRNNPNTPGPQPVEAYGTWAGLSYAPGRGGSSQSLSVAGVDGFVPIFPDFTVAEQDQDGDGVVEGIDNCPGELNLDQSDLDLDGIGDACDGDADGDGIIDGDDAAPGDTDNDGSPNDADPDDDDDGVLDGDDNCPLVENGGQENIDGDGRGDTCDDDTDGDGSPDGLEDTFGSDPLTAASLPEFLGFEDSCTDTIDNDGDSETDAGDLGCTDGDGDTVPTSVDNCPELAVVNVLDADGDGVGDLCEPPDLQALWGDFDCSANVAPRDGQAILKIVLSQTPLVPVTTPCPTIGEMVTVEGVSRMWGDGDCSGAVAPRDGQAILKVVLGQPPLTPSTTPCPAIGDSVSVGSVAALPSRTRYE